MLHTVVLTLHSIDRWLIVLAALLAIIRAINGLSFKRGYTKQDNSIGMWFTIFLDIQLLLGIILYYLYTSGFQNISSLMGSQVTRFFGLEHVIAMVIAVVVAHIGRAMVRRAETAPQKHRRTLIWFGVTLLLIVLAIPWPFLPYGRPLL